MGKMNNFFAPHREQAGKGSALTRNFIGSRVRGLLALALCLCMTLGLLPVQAADAAAVPTDNWITIANTAWYNDTKTEFTINTEEELAGLALLVNDTLNPNDFAGKTITLGADMDLSARLWTPIGYSLVDSEDGRPLAFAGTLKGGGYTITGLTINITQSMQYFYGGLLGHLSGRAEDLTLEGVSISLNATTSGVRFGGIAGYSTGTILRCRASGKIGIDVRGGSGIAAYAGGLVGENAGAIADGVVSDMTLRSINDGSDAIMAVAGGIVAYATAGSVKNCVVTGLKLNQEGHVPTVLADTKGVVGKAEAAAVTVENCFFSAPGQLVEIVSGPATVNNCYWQSGADSSGSTKEECECFIVGSEHVAGTSQYPIDTQNTSAYAQTNSLVEALNGWVADQGEGTYSEWDLKGGVPIQTVFLPPRIDIDAVEDQKKESAKGDISAEVTLLGQFQEDVTLLSVTLPATIPFIMDIDRTGKLTRVLSGTATLENRSDVGVTVTLDSVRDDEALLGEVDLFLVPDPAPAGGGTQISLVSDQNQNVPLATMGTTASGTPATATVKVDGEGKSHRDLAGFDGKKYTLELTFKVTTT